MTQAYVLGGGIAGITAALRLLDRGYRVELVERHRWLGGRAFSVEDQRMGGLRDNGPHVILGCYDAMRWMLRRIGSEQEFLQTKRLRMCYVRRGGARCSLNLSVLPTPLAMPLALLTFSGMRLGEKLRAMRGMVSSLRRAPAQWSLAEWLVDRTQEGAPRDFLWDPLCRAIMNAEAHQVSAELFLECLRRAFGGRASRAAIWYPKRPWLEVVGRPAEAQLQKEGAKVTLGCGVQHFRIGEGRVRGIGLDDGREIAVGDDDLVVSAMPWHRIAPLLSTDHRHPGMELESSPILAVYFDAGEQNPLPDQEPLTYMVGADPFHYVYRTPGDRAGRFALIADGCQSLTGRSTDEITEVAREHLQDYYGVELPEDTPARVAKEARATFVASPDVPGRRTPAGSLPSVSNMMVCGEWADSGLPSTMEGAAISAQKAVP